MGKPSVAIHGPSVASTALSTFTVFLSLVAPPTVHLNSILNTLTKSVRDIVAITLLSQQPELVEFGGYVEKMVNQLVLALQNDKLTRQPNVVKQLEGLQRTLCTISDHISYIEGSGGWYSRFRRVLLHEEIHIPRMRQQLDDALSVFQFAAFLELLSRHSTPSNGAAEVNASVPDQLPVFDPFDAPAQDCSVMQRRQAFRPIEQAQAVRPLPPHSDNHRTPLLTSLHRTLTTTTTDDALKEGELITAFKDVERRRHLFRHDASVTHTIDLAAALGRLSRLLAEKGRTHEALETSQESAGLYRSLAERQH